MRSLRELIFENEDEKLELKERPWNLDTAGGKAEFIKDVSEMANAPGRRVGQFILGVTDEERIVVGIDRRSLVEERLQQIVAEYVDPPFELNYTVQSLRDKAIGVISIPHSSQKPHMIGKNIGKLRQGTCYTRRGSTTDLARSSDIRKMVEETLSEEPRIEIASEEEWSRQDVRELSPLARKILWAFVETGRTELSIEKLKEFCRDELRGSNHPGKTMAGTLKTFYSRHGKHPLVCLNSVTSLWRFDERYRKVVESVLTEMGLA